MSEENNKLVLEAGKYYRSRDGEKVYLVGRLPDELNDCHGNWVCWACDVSWQVHDTGTYWDDGEEDGADLVAEWSDECDIGAVTESAGVGYLTAQEHAGLRIDPGSYLSLRDGKYTTIYNNGTKPIYIDNLSGSVSGYLIPEAAADTIIDSHMYSIWNGKVEMEGGAVTIEDVQSALDSAARGIQIGQTSAYTVYQNSLAGAAYTLLVKYMGEHLQVHGFYPVSVRVSTKELLDLGGVLSVTSAYGDIFPSSVLGYKLDLVLSRDEDSDISVHGMTLASPATATPSVATQEASKSASAHFDDFDKHPVWKPACDHDYRNMGFMFPKWVCMRCNHERQE